MTITHPTTVPPLPLGRGLWGVLATPFHGAGLEVDEVSLRREVQHYVDVPADGLVVLGVFGEGASLDAAERCRTVAAVADAAPGTPLVVGLSARATAVAVEQGHQALEAAGRPVGLMVQVNVSEPSRLVDHLWAVHEATGSGVVLQDYPASSGVRIGSDAVLSVLEQCPFVVAVKSESPPTSVAVGRLAGATTVPVFGGLGGVGLLDELAAGAAGAMTGFSHPEGLRRTIDAYAVGGFAAAREAFAPWLPLVNYEAQPGIGLAIRKEIFRRRGLFADGAVRPPSAVAPAEILALLPGHLEEVSHGPAAA